jgi:nucleotide-binding universal stress UspA family protein
MARARALLDKWGVPYSMDVAAGDPARVIDEYARGHGCSGIVMGAPPRSPFLAWLGDPAAARLTERSAVPVELVPGEPGSRLRRYAFPAFLGLAFALLVIA